jgi:predicted helicase
LFANELVLLAYYISCVNIENAFHFAMNYVTYEPFRGMALTDTFRAWDDHLRASAQASAGAKKILFDDNAARVARQAETPITVVMGNPPYSAGQRSANDDAQNYKYEKLDGRIAETYARLSDAGLKAALYDSYIRAFRYATDRLKDNDGVVCFVSNGGWLDGASTAGFRRTIEKEFARIYVYNLRGNQRTSGELSRKEGGKIFDSGSRASIAIALLVKRTGHKGKAEILYRDIGDYLGRDEKLAQIRDMRSFLSPEMNLVSLTPNAHGDWIITRNEYFNTCVPLAPEKKFDEETESVFVVSSIGTKSQRDAWVYNYSKDAALNNMRDMIDFYNSQLGAAEIDYDSAKISWTNGLMADRASGRRTALQKDEVALTLYRPFQKQWLYRGERVIERRGQQEQFFPTPDTKNMVICVSGAGVTKDFSCLISDRIADLEYVGKSQCFPLHFYDKGGTRRDGISDHALGAARAKYGGGATKEDIFFYAYGLLHHPLYRETFKDDLKKSLPRIPFVESREDFMVFAAAGRALAKLHLDYDKFPASGFQLSDGSWGIQALPEVKVSDRGGDYKVTKMRFPRRGERDTIVFNPSVTISGIPAKAYEYIVNGKSAIEWVMDRYQVKTDKDSGIANDPNLYALEAGCPKYILRLLLSVIAVSVGTVEIVEGLPAFTPGGS